MSEKGAKELRRVGFGFTWEDYTVGDRLKTLGRTVTETDIVNFVGVTGMNEAIYGSYLYCWRGVGRARSASSPNLCAYWGLSAST